MTKQGKNLPKFNNYVNIFMKIREENVLLNQSKTVIIQVKIERSIWLTNIEISKLGYKRKTFS